MRIRTKKPIDFVEVHDHAAGVSLPRETLRAGMYSITARTCGYVWLKNGRQNVRYAMRESLMEEAIKRGLAEIRFDVEVTAELF